MRWDAGPDRPLRMLPAGRPYPARVTGDASPGAMDPGVLRRIAQTGQRPDEHPVRTQPVPGRAHRGADLLQLPAGIDPEVLIGQAVVPRRGHRRSGPGNGSHPGSSELIAAQPGRSATNRRAASSSVKAIRRRCAVPSPDTAIYAGPTLISSAGNIARLEMTRSGRSE